MNRKSTSIDTARALAKDWRRSEKDAAQSASIADHFKHATPNELIRMWENDSNLAGRPLSDFEWQALIEAWCRVFGSLPPDEDETASEEAVEPAPLPDDRTMLQMRDVTRLTGLSKSTIKRQVVAGTFPKPLKLSARRLGWLAQEVNAWFSQLDEQRNAKVRH